MFCKLFPGRIGGGRLNRTLDESYVVSQVSFVPSWKEGVGGGGGWRGEDEGRFLLAQDNHPFASLFPSFAFLLSLPSSGLLALVPLALPSPLPFLGGGSGCFPFLRISIPSTTWEDF